MERREGGSVIEPSMFRNQDKLDELRKIMNGTYYGIGIRHVLSLLLCRLSYRLQMSKANKTLQVDVSAGSDLATGQDFRFPT